jgi:hypothetical protein
MGGKALKTEDVSPTLHMSECLDGFWLYDDTRGMNLAMQSKSKEDAYITALFYYQRRLKKVEQDYKMLRDRVDAFVEQVKEEE